MVARSIALVTLLCLTLCVGCGGSQPPAPTTAPATAPTAASNPSSPTTAGAAAQPAATAAASAPSSTPDADALTQQVANVLQACSYDGKPVRFGMGGDAPTDCRDMVDEIMHYTGLPQNFDVTEADVPNAAAAILLDQDKLPHRVIAFNPAFIEEVNQAVGGNRWAAVSIMAHEIAHHLAGHTIQPGGSQPPTELEADKYSGFMLYTMGANLDDALIAMKTLVPEGPDGPTHPGQGKRVTAITAGWTQACEQARRTDCAQGLAEPGTAPQATTKPKPTTKPDATAEATTEPDATAEPTTEPDVTVEPGTTTNDFKGDVLPKPDANALPSKGKQFIYDETGLFDRPTIQQAEKKFFDLAQKKGVEIVVIIANDFSGMKPDEYAWTMLRQLRVGKLDVGNGAVFAYSWKTKEFGLATGPALYDRIEHQIDTYRTGAQFFFDSGQAICEQYKSCSQSWTELLLGDALSAAGLADYPSWEIRYQDLTSLFAAAKKADEDKIPAGPNHPTNGALTRLQGVVEDLNYSGGMVNDLIVKEGYLPVKVKETTGATVIIYVRPATMDLQPAGKLEVGKTYNFIARVQGIVMPDTEQQFYGYSYDLLGR